MRLAKLAIRRFKAIDELTLTIPKTVNTRPGSADFLSFVGENNTAKSSVLQALLLALPGTELKTPTEHHFPGRDAQHGPIEVEFTFDDLTQYDIEEQGIRTHVYDEKYRIKKVWESPNTNATIWAYEPQYNYPTWPDPDTSIQHFRDAGDHWPELLELYIAEHDELPARVSAAFREELKEIAIRTDSPLVIEAEPTWFQNPGGFSAHVDSILPIVISVPAIKETKKEAEVTQKKSAARQIVEAMFSRELEGNQTIIDFIEAGFAVKGLFAEEEGNQIVKRLEERISTSLQRFIDLSASLDFDPPDVRADLAGRTTLELIDGENRTKPEHQGHGAQRALILTLLEILAQDSLPPSGDRFTHSILLLIEEPEIYLHPQMCRKMRDVLIAIAQSGTAQVICTTHSPVFLDLADRHDGIAIFRRDENEITVLQRTDDIYSDDTTSSSRDRLRMLLNFDPTVNEVFFARKVCLVEGDCEIASLDAVAQQLSSNSIISLDKYLLSRRELAVVNCRGKWTILAFQRVLNGFNIPYQIVHDSDQEGESGANAAILELLGEDEERRLLHNPNFETQIFGESWRRDKPWKATQTIIESYELPGDLLTFFCFVLSWDLNSLSS